MRKHIIIIQLETMVTHMGGDEIDTQGDGGAHTPQITWTPHCIGASPDQTKPAPKLNQTKADPKQPKTNPHQTKPNPNHTKPKLSPTQTKANPSHHNPAGKSSTLWVHTHLPICMGALGCIFHLPPYGLPCPLSGLKSH